jgi:hypothetical protein
MEKRYQCKTAVLQISRELDKTRKRIMLASVMCRYLGMSETSARLNKIHRFLDSEIDGLIETIRKEYNFPKSA